MIRYAARTRTGHLHSDNQDRLAADVERGTFIVVDGMGGLAEASATAQAVVEQFPRRVRERVTALHGPDVAQAVTAVAAELNERVRQGARAGPDSTGAAVALLLVRDGLALVVHLGDSRIYLARDGRLRRLTEDHTRGGQLTRFVGMPGEVVPGVSVTELYACDRILLCTDGLTGSVDDRALAELLTTPDGLDGVCGQLVEAATAGGAVDDISVIAIEYDARNARGMG
ncbi:PP2C family protein-serine/threonine phosphatase [Frankia sp. CiP1_Cm_nod2]|uniref:PP2C family protein-serine/threonine phosphatase n=1 Tax=Frankia sp. CiP1_Cm_nod2 TaxID=2897161 RepID=UPI0020259826